MEKLLLKTMVRCSIPMSWLLLMFAAGCGGKSEATPDGNIAQTPQNRKNQKAGDIPPPANDKKQAPKTKTQPGTPDKNTFIDGDIA